MDEEAEQREMRRNKKEFLSQSNSCTNRYNTTNENELRHVQSKDGKSPNGPLCRSVRAE